MIGDLIATCGLFVLLLLHYLYSVFIYLYDYLSYTFKQIKKFTNRTNVNNSVTVLKKELSTFPKFPNHVVIIIQEQDVSYKDCVKLILWCIYSGIPYVTFYSSSSAINPTSLYEVLCKRSKNSLQSIRWGKSFHKSVKEMAKKDINGYAWKPVIEVNLFSLRTVHQSIENVLLSLCSYKVEPEQLSIPSIDEKFRTEIPLPDPCLAIVCGKTFSTFGFLPWQIRVTELQHFTTHHNLQIEDFVGALRRYAFCEQRFGK